MERAVVAIGSNLGDPYENLLTAQQWLIDLPHSRDFSFSPIYRTAPIDSPGAPDYLNAALCFHTDLSPETLLSELLALETRAGRVRPFVNAPRTLDLDLILLGSHVIQTERLTLPHPRFHERFFVLVPMNDLVPDTPVPLLDADVRTLLTRLEAREDRSVLIHRDARTFPE